MVYSCMIIKIVLCIKQSIEIYFRGVVEYHGESGIRILSKVPIFFRGISEVKQMIIRVSEFLIVGSILFLISLCLQLKAAPAHHRLFHSGYR